MHVRINKARSYVSAANVNGLFGACFAVAADVNDFPLVNIDLAVFYNTACEDINQLRVGYSSFAWDIAHGAVYAMFNSSVVIFAMSAVSVMCQSTQ